MLKWCAYCQHFLGEEPPFENQGLSHGMCEACAKRGLQISQSEFEQMKVLKTLQSQLWQAGKTGDVKEACRLIENAASLGLRPVDVLMGLLGPMLYEIGNEWAQGRIIAADEQRFTEFAKNVLAVIREQSAASYPFGKNPRTTSVLLVRLEGNAHGLGLDALDLYLRSLGVSSQVVQEELSESTLTALAIEVSPRVLGISIALPEQRTAAFRAVTALKKLTDASALTIILGGFAVKQGEVEPIDGTLQLKELSELKAILSGLKIMN